MPLLHDIAHLGHAELLTPEPDKSLWFFTQVLGLTENGTSGDSVYLRTWDDYEHHSLKLTASATSGLGRTGLRATTGDALTPPLAEIPARPGARADRARRPHRRRGVAALRQEVRGPPVHQRLDRDERPAAPHRVRHRRPRGRAPGRGPLPGPGGVHRDRAAQARHPADVL